MASQMLNLFNTAVADMELEGYKLLSKEDSRYYGVEGLNRCKERKILELRVPSELYTREICLDLTWTNELEIKTSFFLKIIGGKKKVYNMDQWNQLKPSLSPFWEQNALLRGELAE
jgi:hypothetical protein